MLTITDMPSVMQHFHRQRADGRAMAAAVGASYFTDQPAAAPIPLTLDVTRGPPRSDHDILPLGEIEKRAILRALEHTNGDRAVAANLLGIGRTTLYRKRKEYAIAAS